jgi:hypothetical protein
MLTAHLHLVPMRGAIPPLPCRVSWRGAQFGKQRNNSTYLAGLWTVYAGNWSVPWSRLTLRDPRVWRWAAAPFPNNRIPLADARPPESCNTPRHRAFCVALDLRKFQSECQKITVARTETRRDSWVKRLLCLKCTRTTPRKCMGEWRYRSMYPWLGHEERSRYSDWIRAVRPRGRSSGAGRVKNFLHVVQTGSGVHPTSYPMGPAVSFPGQ